MGNTYFKKVNKFIIYELNQKEEMETNNINDEEKYLEFTDLSEDGMSRLSKLTSEQLSLQIKLEKLEKEAAEVKEKLRNISETLIPDLMESLNMESFTTSAGLCVEVKQKIRTSITETNRQEAIKWLVNNGFAASVKNEVKVSFSKDEYDKAQNLAADLRDKNFPALENQTVHPQTLQSIVTNCLKDGVNIPLELFSVFRQRSTKIS